MSALYLLILVAAMTCVGLVDYRYKLALFGNHQRTLVVIGVMVLFFVTWDIGGISQGVFYEGDSPYLIGLSLRAQFPIEELFFLTHLSYTTLVIWRFLEVRWKLT